MSTIAEIARGSDRFGPRPQHVSDVRPSVGPEARRRQPQRDTLSERLFG